MTTSVASLGSILDLGGAGDDVWIGHGDGVPLPQLYGGQLVAQSIIAAGRSVDEGRLVNSLHTTFLRPGRSDRPIRFEVERLRDGRQFSTRVVDAVQDDRLVCRSTISLVEPRDGLAHSRRPPLSAAAEASTDLRVLAEHDGGLGEYWEGFSTVEVRVAPEDPVAPPHSAAPVQNIWMRVTEDLGDDPLLHQAAIGYVSDLMLMSMAVAPHGHRAGHERSLAERWSAVSLDHTLWFHRPARADEWLLFEHASPTAHDGRALVEAAVFGDADAQVCHVVQEALVREN
ncbi:acyl-CoA thioesterase [Aeromicrobium choanae]|uniref:Acyl-CoA thioesterase-2 n=1 Tax=Aeromicrobium choanae TaxID=1736691 RepID=A0A1T4YTP9_9ACTN|nr:acyl-CoA thioesterase domain-containing protein [Aeromicrobium choanae]SKB05237.1 acyl-CoA thioesterase-2 [Aeromicrobium choanae]